VALRVLQFAATIPAGTPKTSPVTTPLNLDGWTLVVLDLEVPPGPAGLMGFYVSNNGVQWIPQPPGTYLVWDNRLQSWPLNGQPNAGGWAIVGYNTGAYPHTVTARAHVNPATPAATPPVAPAITFVTHEPAEREPVLI
jgi:hypothetical protein